MQVYLTGPITGRSNKRIADWRTYVRQRCQGIDFVDPSLQHSDPSNAYKKKETDSEALRRLSHGRFVIDRNKLLIKGADLVFANFLEATDRASIGGVGELFFANAFGKPIVLVRERHGNIHDHAMLNAIATKVCFSLDDGCDAISAILGQQLHIA